MPHCLWLHGLQQTRLPFPSLSLRVCWNSDPLSQWCCLTSSSSVVPFFFCLQSFPASWSFPKKDLWQDKVMILFVLEVALLIAGLASGRARREAENPVRRLCSINPWANGSSHWVSDLEQLDSRDALDLLMGWVLRVGDREKARMTSRQFGCCHLAGWKMVSFSEMGKTRGECCYLLWEMRI